MKLYNTFSKRNEEILNLTHGVVKIYTCGPTMNGRIHLGNARPYVVMDSLSKYLSSKGQLIMHVQNITDIEDRLVVTAEKEGKTLCDYTEEYINEYIRDLKGLGLDGIDSLVLASGNIEKIKEMVKEIYDNEYAYTSSNGDIYFDTSKMENYGELANKEYKELVDAWGVNDGERRSPLDFPLWITSDSRLKLYESPWGKGIPGWHIECVSLVESIFGGHVDIHAGAEDLTFPHHDSELILARSLGIECYSKLWIHTGLVTVNGKKMAKSKGNIVTVREMAEKYGYAAIRLFLLDEHYRKRVEFCEEKIERMHREYNSIERTLIDLQNMMNKPIRSLKDVQFKTGLIEFIERTRDAFFQNLDNDFNTHEAITEVLSLVHTVRPQISQLSIYECTMINKVLRNMISILGIV